MATPAETAKQLKKLFGHLPGVFQEQPNFKALLGAIAQSDADLENLFIEVKKQLFVDTAEGEYLDTLGANSGVTRPPLIGMVDKDFREFIKLQTYYPKQIRQLLFRLMELFYGRDTIKANIRCETQGNYSILDESTLIVRVDGINDITITLKASSFNDPSNVSPNEIAAQINYQVNDTIFASTYFNSIDKKEYLEIFTNTFGPVGSIAVLGGTANRFLKFPSTFRSGASVTTQYKLVKQFAEMKLYWAGGSNPLYSAAQVGDSVILTGSAFALDNTGSFTIESIADTGVPAVMLASTSATYISPNLVRYAMPSTTYVALNKDVTVSGFSNSSNNGTFKVIAITGSYIDLETSRLNAADDESASASVDLLPSAAYISFTNDSGIAASVFSVTSNDDVLFFRSIVKKLQNSKRAATTWEITPNEIVVTLPATPVIIRRGLAGSAHVQGTTATISRTFSSQIDMLSPLYFPAINGRFYLQGSNGTVNRNILYSYSAINGTSIIGVTPTPIPYGDRLSLGAGPLSASNGSGILTISTASDHDLIAGELIKIQNFDGFAGWTDAQINQTLTVSNVINTSSFQVNLGVNATSTTSNAPAEGKGEILTTHNMQVMPTNIVSNTGYVSSYIYDQDNAPYTISNQQTTLNQDVLIGEFSGAILVNNSNVFSENTGEVVLNYGRQDEEGPIKYISKPSSSVLFFDPSYRFQKSHFIGAAVNLLRSRLATAPGVVGANYPVYIVDTITPRERLKELILEAKAAGVSVRFIVVLPDNVYNAFSLYENI